MGAEIYLTKTLRLATVSVGAGAAYGAKRTPRRKLVGGSRFGSALHVAFRREYSVEALVCVRLIQDRESPIPFGIKLFEIQFTPFRWAQSS